MKNLILPLLVVLSTLTSIAQPYTTYRNVYNFNVGDVFEYTRTGYTLQPSLGDLQRFEIINKTYTNDSTVQYGRKYYYIQEYLVQTGTWPPVITKKAYTTGTNVVTYTNLNDTVALPSRNIACDSTTSSNHTESVYFDSSYCSIGYKHSISNESASYPCLVPYDAKSEVSIFVNELGCVKWALNGTDSGHNISKSTELYHYIKTDSLGTTTCGVTDTSFNYFTVNLNEQAQNSVFTAYPNPASNEMNISYNGTGAATLTLTNVLGQVVQSIVLTNPSTTINTSALPSGVYIATLYPTNASVTQQKISIHR